MNRVATYKELDTDLFRHAAFATLDDIDLRLLTKCMSPEQEIKEVNIKNAFPYEFIILLIAMVQLQNCKSQEKQIITYSSTF